MKLPAHRAGHLKTVLTAWEISLRHHDRIYLLITSAVTLSPTVRAKYPSSHSSPPQSCFLYFRILLEYYTRAYTLQHPYDFPDAVPRWKRQEYMNMVLGYLQFIYLKIVMPSFPQIYSLTRSLLFPAISIFDILVPTPMIFRIIYRMTRSFQSHACYIITCSPCLRQENFSSPFTKRGIQLLFFINLNVFPL